MLAQVPGHKRRDLFFASAVNSVRGLRIALRALRLRPYRYNDDRRADHNNNQHLRYRLRHLLRVDDYEHDHDGTVRRQLPVKVVGVSVDGSKENLCGVVRVFNARD